MFLLGRHTCLHLPRAIEDLGYTGVQLVDPVRWGVAKAAGLPIVNPAAPGMHDGVSTENDRPALVPPQFYHSIETANANGISHVIVPFGNRHGQNNQSELTQSIAVSKDLAR